MKRIQIEKQNKLVLENISGFLVRTVTPVGTSAKVSCPKEFLGKKVYLVFLDES